MKATVGYVYTLREIMTMLEGNMDVYLQFFVDNLLYPLQNSHVTSEQLLSIEGFANTYWKYVCRTREEIDVFTYIGGKDIEQFVERAEWGIVTSFYEVVYTPKGFPREDPWKEEQ